MSALRTSRSVAAAIMRGLRWAGRRIQGRVEHVVGGPARTRVVTLFAGVLALSSAQIATVGSVAPQLQSSLHLDNYKIGLLNSVTLIVAAVAVIPIGLVVDRLKRIPMLSISIVLWSVATILGAVANSYGTLLLTRVALGIVSASAGPAIASLTGDYFPSDERGRVYGYILTGEILGTAVGFVVCGNVAGAFGWRAAFWVLAIPGFFLARSLWRSVPEPRRGGHDRLERGVVDLRDHAPRTPTEVRGPRENRERDLAYRMAEDQGYRPDPRLVLQRDPDRMSLQDAVRYILSIPTNVLLIISSSLGYFFFSGLETYATLFVVSHFHTSQSEATLVLGVLVLGAVCGTLAVGPIVDALTRRGSLAARVWVPAVCNAGAAVLLIPGFLTSSLSTSVFFCFFGTALISAANPPLDAARLDIMPSGLWGRAESTRTFLRSIAQALAPLAFGAMADLIAGFRPHQAPVGTHTGPIASGTGTGLEVSFLVMLLSLFAGAWFLWRSRPSYPRDIATAAAGFSPLRGSADPTTPPASPTRRRESRAAARDRAKGGGAHVSVTDMRISEDPTVVQRHDAPTEAQHDAENPTEVQRGGEDPTEVQHGGEDPTEVQHGGEDPTEVQHGAENPTEVQHGADDPTVRRPRRDGGDDPESLIFPR
ncbi:MAG TPA: MFS transporter [Solirubrobacteraceae bacterium]|nr:MFS transporter [Solirubrobacteraceae bacterium]